MSVKKKFRLPLELFLAFRYLRPKRTFVSFITLLSVLGPALGVAVLLIVNAVMLGFQRNIKESIMNWQAHLHVHPLHAEVFDERELQLLQEILARHGVTSAPIIQTTALVQVRQHQDQTCVPKIVNGIDPARERDISGLVNGKFQGRFDIAEKEAIIGWRMAAGMGLKIGSEFLLHSPARLTKNIRFSEDGQLDVGDMDEVYLPERVKVAGIFDMGLADLDDGVIYIHQDQAAELQGYEWRSATSLQGKVKDPMQMQLLVQELTAELQTRMPRPVRLITWQERNAMLFETLRVEHVLLLFLMTFILVVASFSIAATLITVVVKKTREIGVLKAMGVSSWCVARIFILEGLVIGVIGALIGTVLGTLVVIYRTQVAAFLSWVVGHEVFPAELYHLSEIPAELTCQDVTCFNVLALVICVLSALIPSLFAALMTPAKSLQEN